MNWDTPDQIARNVVWSERCRREVKNLHPELWTFAIPSHEQLRRSAVGPGSINDRDVRFLDKRRPALAALSNFVSPTSTSPEALYVLEHAKFAPRKVAPTTLRAHSSHSTVYGADGFAMEKAGARHPRAVSSLGSLPYVAGQGRDASSRSGSAMGQCTYITNCKRSATAMEDEPVRQEAHDYGLSVPSTSTSLVLTRSAESRQRTGYHVESYDNPHAPPVCQEAHAPESAAPRAVPEAGPTRVANGQPPARTLELLDVIKEQQRVRGSRRRFSITSGDYGWIPPSALEQCRAANIAPTAWPRADPRFKHPLPHTDVTRVRTWTTK